jgi:hypothetical protein
MDLWYHNESLLKAFTKCMRFQTGPEDLTFDPVGKETKLAMWSLSVTLWFEFQVLSSTEGF